MNALAELKKRAGTPANVANPANLRGCRAGYSQDSQDSQGVESEKRISAGAAVVSSLSLDALKQERARLLALAAAEWIDAAHVHRLQDVDLAECVALGLDDCQRVAYLSMLADTADRHAGRVPEADTAAMHCQHCGPVWTQPAIAAVLPVVDGWPRALGCPWCFVRKAGGYIPRPSITCGGCQHFAPDTINPPAGMGTCNSGHGMYYPMKAHRCAAYLISTKKGDLA
jgi:hypothetical protein